LATAAMLFLLSAVQRCHPVPVFYLSGCGRWKSNEAGMERRHLEACLLSFKSLC
jgi:hypothetical protein